MSKATTEKNEILALSEGEKKEGGGKQSRHSAKDSGISQTLILENCANRTRLSDAYVETTQLLNLTGG